MFARGTAWSRAGRCGRRCRWQWASSSAMKAPARLRIARRGTSRSPRQAATAAARSPGSTARSAASRSRFGSGTEGVGGSPQEDAGDNAQNEQQFAPSNWINDDWAWKLFGARSYDDIAKGTFTAYVEVGDPKGKDFDCRVDACGIFTRNDHTALSDRVQDLYVPVEFG